jgi:hypothetical protein
MATLPTPEESARRVLDIYKHFGTRPGEGLSTQNFLTVAANQGLCTDDLLDGMRYGDENDWFEDGPNGSVLLTEAGFAEISNA